MSLVRVKVVVLEDGMEVASRAIDYYEGQDYWIEVATPDGTDCEVFRGTAGKDDEE